MKYLILALWALSFIFTSLTAQPSCDELNCLLSIEKVLPDCNQSNGSLSPILPQQYGPYQFQWSTGQNGETATGLEAGWYDLTVLTTMGGCTLQKTISLPNLNAPALNLDIHEIRCADGNDGRIEVLPSGGQAPYSYTWSGGENSSQLSNLSADLYTVSVLDNAGCQNQIQYLLQAPDPDNIIPQIESVSCLGGDGAIYISASGPNFPYTYLWKDNGSTSSFRTDLSTGIYTFQVINNKGCVQSFQEEITAASEDFGFTSSFVGSTGCGLLANGVASVQAAGTNGPYEFIWEDGTIAPFIFGKEAGFYKVTVYDADGCSESHIITIPHVSGSFSLNATTTDAGCQNDAGSINLTVTGFNGPYQFLWSTSDTTEDLSNLSGGTYYCTVTDMTGCKDVIEVLVPNNQHPRIDPVIINAHCGQATGGILLNPSEGSTPYTFSWSNGYTGPNPSSLSAGNYNLSMTDAAGCNQNYSLVVPEDSLLSLEPQYMVEDVSCNGLTDGMVGLFLTGGTADYDVLWSNGATTDQISNLSAGSYFLELTNTNGCKFYDAIGIREPDDIRLLSCAAEPACFGGNNGMIGLEVYGGQALFQIDWASGASGPNRTNLSAGTYFISVSDAAGCQESFSIDLTEPDSIQISIQSSPDSTEMGVGTASAQVNGGNPPYTYHWTSNPPQNGQTATNLPEGNYDLYIQDAHGCTDTASVFIGTTDIDKAFMRLKASIYPNPNPGSFYLEINESLQTARIQISDLNGRMLWNESRSISAQQAILIQTSSLPVGLYIVKILSEGNSYYQRISIE